MKTVVIDTNVILRFLLQDIPEQSSKAQAVFDDITNHKVEGLLSLLVINETLWILSTFYKLDRSVFIPQLTILLALNNIKTIEVKKEIIMQSLASFLKYNVDFTDIYLFTIAGKYEIVSFDIDFKKLKRKQK